jgi:hypothetical protein
LFGKITAVLVGVLSVWGALARIMPDVFTVRREHLKFLWGPKTIWFAVLGIGGLLSGYIWNLEARLTKLTTTSVNVSTVADETQLNLTLNITTHGFGEGSQNVSQFSRAGWAGSHHSGGMSPALLQSNYNKRIDAYTATLRSSITELELMMPEPEISGAYEPGDEYSFYRDLKTLVGLATRELLIVDNYLGTELFDIYMENVRPGVSARVLSNEVKPSVRAVAEKFAKQRGNFELRSTPDNHDRAVFADDRGWIIGQSIKDAAVKKPTSIVEFPNPARIKAIYEAMWATATTVVKS